MSTGENINLCTNSSDFVLHYFLIAKNRVAAIVYSVFPFFLNQKKNITQENSCVTKPTQNVSPKILTFFYGNMQLHSMGICW